MSVCRGSLRRGREASESARRPGDERVLPIGQNLGMTNASTLDALPTPEAVADDLEKIVSNLGRYKNLTLAALRSLPSIRAWGVGRDGFTERERSNLAIVAAISSAVDRFLHDPGKQALEELFTFQHPGTDLGARQDAAGVHLGITGDGMRKGRQKALLRDLGDELFRGEVAWCLDQVAATADAQAGTWYRVLEWERSLTVDPKKPTRQVWDTRILLRCRTPAHPIYTTVQKWTGQETEDAKTVTILSGPQDKDDPFRHRLLAVRPEQRAVDAFTLYVFDLGHLVVPDQEIELRYRQVLTDAAGTSKPMVGFSTLIHPEARLVRLRASVPEIDEADVYVFRVPGNSAVPLDGGPTAQTYRLPSYSDQAPQKIKRGNDGYLTYEIAENVPGGRYELWWGSLT
jgi:hypothetical protein